MVPVGVIFPADIVEIGPLCQLAFLRDLGIFENDADRALADPAALIEVVELDLDLVRAGLERGTEFAIATRGGVRNVVIHEEGDISVEMGIATTPRARAMPVVSVDSQSWTGVGVLVPNPHCVVFLDDESSAQRSDSHGDIGLSSSVLSHLDLSNAPDVGPAAVFPDGVNVEFVRRIGSIDSRHLLMRVHERGVGETLACGTGACAVMWAAAVRDEAPEVVEYTVEMPGGTVTVRRDAEGHLHLRGPAVIVGSITLGAQVVPLV